MSQIILHSVSLEFPIYGMNTRSLKKQLLRLTTGGKFKHSDNKVVTIKALDNLSLTIQKGDRVGLIGHNGAGKSTLLRVLAKIYEPTIGKLHIQGKVSALLDLMLGMDPESTGYENILIRGILNGLTREQIKAKTKEIAEFTELGDYLSVPIRTYSSGMQLRLAFGIASSIYTEILLLDEVVGTGDAAFMEKAEQRFHDMVNQSHIVVLATHDLTIMKKICNKVIWLEAGKIQYFGDIKTGLDQYQRIDQKTNQNKNLIEDETCVSA